MGGKGNMCAADCATNGKNSGSRRKWVEKECNTQNKGIARFSWTGGKETARWQ
jgi:hypothetical protein